MDLTRAIDAYCERVDPAFWAEPVNAVTNLAFIVAALVMWRRVRGQGMVLAEILVWILAAIGVGSFLFHTRAQVWAAIADTAPILIFVLVYIHAANRHYWGLRRWPALGLTVLFFPFAALTVPLFRMIPGLGSSAGYAPVPVLIAIYAVLLWRRLPEVARGLGIGAALLVLSLTFRSFDLPLCSAMPLGTHFLWHLTNAVMLGWMIEVLWRHLVRAGRYRSATVSG